MQAAGGTKRVAVQLWPTLDVSSATSRLRASLNPDHAQKLCPEEVLAIARLGKESGDNSVMQFLARDLGYEVKPLSPAASRKHARLAKRASLLDQILKLDDEERLEDEE